MIAALQAYWAEQGCVILQPYDMEVGAGTFHPATFFKAIALSHGAQLMSTSRRHRRPLWRKS